MILSKILSKYQITLPKEAVRALHLSKGDFLKCLVEKGKVSFAPVVVEEPYSDEELKKFDKLYNNPANRGKKFRSAKAAIEHLKNL